MSRAEQEAVGTLGWTPQSWDEGQSRMFERSWDSMQNGERNAGLTEELANVEKDEARATSTTHVTCCCCARDPGLLPPHVRRLLAQLRT